MSSSLVLVPLPASVLRRGDSVLVEGDRCRVGFVSPSGLFGVTLHLVGGAPGARWNRRFSVGRSRLVPVVSGLAPAAPSVPRCSPLRGLVSR